ncbi:MAG TPA: GNAT family N-acetyltransferase [Isosphaeraceae bacterium]|nr:GNAT family N-acetyltransferase [Isosphaeraceae bacterium]
MVRIRRANLTDSDRVFELVKEFATSFQPELDSFRRSFSQIILKDDALLIVAQDSGKLLGYLLGFDHPTLFANGSIAWAEEVAVEADRRRQGIGRQLMREFEEWARSRGSRLVALATRRATDFYLSLGYEESATYFRKLL